MEPITFLNPGTVPLDSATDRADLTREDFFKILVSELTNQDPLEPLDNQQLLQQLSQLQDLEATATLTDAVNGMVRFQQLGSASVLIGRMVHGLDDDGQPVEGVVDRVIRDADGIRLALEDGRTLDFGAVTQVAQTDPDANQAA